MTAARVALAIICLAVGAVAGFVLRPVDESDAELVALQAELDAAQSARTAAEGELSSAERRARSAERGLKQARRELATVEIASSKTSTDPSGSAENASTGDAGNTGDTSWKARVAEWPAYRFEGADDVVQTAITNVDWIAIADSMSGMVPIANRIAGAILEGVPPAPEDIGNAQKRNGPLVGAAITLNRAGVPGTGPNGAFSHPAFMTNAIAANLEALGMPLDAAQRERLGRLGNDYTRRDEARLGAYEDGLLELRKIVEEAELKEAYFADVFAMLNAAQREALSPALSRGRVRLDVFSAALVWAGRVQPIGYRDEAHLAELLESRFMSAVVADSRDGAHQIVMAWVERLPNEITSFRPDPLDQAGLMRSEHVNRCANELVKLIETLRRDGALGDAADATLQRFGSAVVPFVTGAD